MCGIYGFNWEDKILLNSMCKVLEHRGPDGHGLFLEKGLSLGHRRLAIIDLSEKGKQPMEYEHNGKRVVITFNGEIYNYEEIKKDLQKKGYKFKSDSDTEVILASYLEHGETCVNHFNGMWAFCIYDSTKKILFMSRDSIGEKPLYYYLEKDKFIFASEIKAILESGIKRSMNKSALNLYLSLRYIPEENTMFEGVKRLLAGHNLIFDLSSKN